MHIKIIGLVFMEGPRPLVPSFKMTNTLATIISGIFDTNSSFHVK